MKKFISAVLFCLWLFRPVAAESCPEELPGTAELAGSGLVLHYGIIETDQALCGKLVSDTEAWVGFGAQPDGVNMMIGAHSIIALPSANTVRQYLLNAKNADGIVLTDSQTLTETSVTQEGGATVATFKQPISFDGLTLTSDNVYMLANGFSNDLGYHVNRGFVSLDFETNVIPSSNSVIATLHPSLQPSLQSSLPPSLFSSSQPSLQSSLPPSLISSTQPSLKSSPSPSFNSSSQPSAQPSGTTSTETSTKPSSRPSLGYTDAPSSEVSSLTSTPSTISLVSTNSTIPSSEPSTLPSLQSTNEPSSIPSTQISLKPSRLPSVEPSSLSTSEKPSTLPSSAPQALGTFTPTIAPSRPTSSPTQPSKGNSQTVPSSEDNNDPTSSSQRKVFSMTVSAIALLACQVYW